MSLLTPVSFTRRGCFSSRMLPANTGSRSVRIVQIHDTAFVSARIVRRLRENTYKMRYPHISRKLIQLHVDSYEGNFIVTLAFFFSSLLCPVRVCMSRNTVRVPICMERDTVRDPVPSRDRDVAAPRNNVA